MRPPSRSFSINHADTVIFVRERSEKITRETQIIDPPAREHTSQITPCNRVTKNATRGQTRVSLETTHLRLCLCVVPGVELACRAQPTENECEAVCAIGVGEEGRLVAKVDVVHRAENKQGSGTEVHTEGRVDHIITSTTSCMAATGHMMRFRCPWSRTCRRRVRCFDVHRLKRGPLALKLVTCLIRQPGLEGDVGAVAHPVVSRDRSDVCLQTERIG